MAPLLILLHLARLDVLTPWASTLAANTAWVAGSFVPLAVLCALVYLDLSAAMRRQERARGFLHLLEIGARRGKSFEETVVSLSRSHEPSLGVSFHLLAAYIEAGHRLNDALARVPHFLPAQIRAMLKAGEEAGDARKVLGVVRQTLTGGRSRSQVEQNNIFIYLFMVPVGVFVIWWSLVFVFPRLNEVVQDMMERREPLVSESLLHWSLYLAVAAMVVWIGFYVAGAIHLAGPRVVSWLEAGLWPVSHRIALWIPWRRKRLQRDFTAMLALLLDAGAPEAKAVELAARSTANRVFIARAQRVTARLGEGTGLIDALRLLDDAGEFQWRLHNAARARAGFTSALAGWKDALEAKAFQQEQTFSQLLTTGLILLNGLMVALVAAALFGIFAALVENAVLW